MYLRPPVRKDHFTSKINLFCLLDRNSIQFSLLSNNLRFLHHQIYVFLMEVLINDVSDCRFCQKIYLLMKNKICSHFPQPEININISVIHYLFIYIDALQVILIDFESQEKLTCYTKGNQASVSFATLETKHSIWICAIQNRHEHADVISSMP